MRQLCQVPKGLLELDCRQCMKKDFLLMRTKPKYVFGSSLILLRPISKTIIQVLSRRMDPLRVPKNNFLRSPFPNDDAIMFGSR